MIDPLQIGGFKASKDENGNWIYKASTNAIKPKKKPQYKDKPQFPVIAQYEAFEKKQMEQNIEVMAKEILKYLKKYSK